MATKELQGIIQARKRARQQGRQAALVTVFQTSGSTYRRAGARMLVVPNAAGDALESAEVDVLGSISGGCLEDDAREQALDVLRRGQATTVHYDTTAEADILFGSGVGCQGIVRALIQPLSAPGEDRAASDPLDCLARSLENRCPGVLATVCAIHGTNSTGTTGAFLWLDGESSVPRGTLLTLDPILAEMVAGDAQTALRLRQTTLHTYPQAGGSVEVFIEPMEPPRSLLICGAGQDAIPLSRLAHELGWRVAVADGRRAYATRDRFPEVDELIVCPPREFAAQGHPWETGEAVVLMTHHYLHDQEFLRAALASPAGYIGVLGPRRRTERLLAELSSFPGVPTGQRSLRRVHGPAGLDIGAETPEQIALAIIAEIEAVGARRRGGILKRRRAPLHDPPRGTGTRRRPAVAL